MEASFRPSVSFLFLFLAFLFLPNFFFFFCTGLLSELRCIDRQALLNFKQHLIDPSNRLSSWTVDGDCCHWLGVVCHNLTAHVHQLHLGSFPPIPDDFMTLEQYDAQSLSLESDKYRFKGELKKLS
nr:receptor-like protein EIX2 [Quercus suber]